MLLGLVILILTTMKVNNETIKAVAQIGGSVVLIVAWIFAEAHVDAKRIEVEILKLLNMPTVIYGKDEDDE